MIQASKEVSGFHTAQSAAFPSGQIDPTFLRAKLIKLWESPKIAQEAESHEPFPLAAR
jgi:hypothetical protein